MATISSWPQVVILSVSMGKTWLITKF